MLGHSTTETVVAMRVERAPEGAPPRRLCWKSENWLVVVLECGRPIDFASPGRLRLSMIAAGEVTMPHYEYLCQACNKKFSLVLTVAEHDKGNIKCPKCGSSNVEQQWAAFYATTSKKS